MTESYVRRTIGLILIYDAGNIASLYDLEDWILRVKEASAYSDKLVISMWRNNRDLEYQIESVSREEAEEFARRHELPLDLIFEVTTKDGVHTGVEMNFQTVIDAVHRKYTDQQRLPAVHSNGNSDGASNIHETLVNLEDNEQQNPVRKNSCFSWC